MTVFHKLTLLELFDAPRGIICEIDSEIVDGAIVAALALDVGKLARLQALLLTAPQPFISGLQSRLFDVLWQEDRNLAVEAILASYPGGATVHRFLLDRMHHLRDPELLRQATGVVAADIKENCDSLLFGEGMFTAIPCFTRVASSLQRLGRLGHRDHEIEELAEAIMRHVQATPGVEHAPKIMLKRLDHALDKAVSIARASQRPRPKPASPGSRAFTPDPS